jgi:hypothetical protein
MALFLKMNIVAEVLCFGARRLKYVYPHPMSANMDKGSTCLTKRLIRGSLYRFVFDREKERGTGANFNDSKKCGFVNILVPCL